MKVMKRVLFFWSIIVVMLVNSTLNVFAGENTERIIQFNSIEEVRDYANANKDINIIVLDEVGTVTNEIHCDGSYIDYTYSNELISEIKNSNGYSRKYLYNDDEVRIDEFKDGKLIKSKTSSKKEEKEKLIIEKDINLGNKIVSPLFTTIATSTREAYYVKGVLMNNLISDSDFSSQSLTQSQIQAFLESKNSVLRNQILVIRQDYYNGPYYLTSTVPVIPSELIARYAKEYTINPKLILVTLQKENSLISKSSVSSSSDSILWAMGVGCYDGGKQNWNYYYCGIDRQIQYGTKTFRDRFDGLSSYSYPRKKTINYGRTVTANGVTYKNYIWVDNKATDVLYIYTPHAIDLWLWDNQRVIGGGNYLVNAIFKGYWSAW